MPLRITTFAAYEAGARHIQEANRELARASELVASGRNLLRPSDGPTDAARALNYRRLLADIDQFKRNALAGQGALAAADTALGGAQDVIGRLRELATLGASGTLGQTERDALAAEAAGLRGQLLSAANTRYGDRYIFAGFASDAPAYDAAGVYQGDGGVTLSEVGEGERVPSAIPGGRIFGTDDGGVDVFAVLTAFETALTAGDAAAVRASMGEFERAANQIGAKRAYLGAQLNRLERVDQALDAAHLNVSKLSSDLEDADMVSAISRFQQAQTLLQATLASTAQTMQTSLLDYL